jgi:hypothetical protein
VHIVKVNGGLGNQMFQYAFALAIDALYGDARLDLEWIRKYRAHNGYELDRLFSVRVPACSLEDRKRLGEASDGLVGQVRRRLRLTKRSYYAARGFGYDPAALERSEETYFAGYWQSPRYFKTIEDEVRAAFTFKPPLSAKSESFLASAAGRTLIGIHARRGDYLADSAYATVCDAVYYKAAALAAARDAEDPLFAFFSDDLDWCRAELRVPGEAIYVDWNRGANSYEDMRLMAACDALVMANSSFSWWGAWLGERPGRPVFVPTHWVADPSRDSRDIVPARWIRVGA